MFDELINNFFLSHYKIILHKDPWCTPARASTYKPLQVSIYYVFLITSGTRCTFRNSNTRLLFFFSYCQCHYARRVAAGNWFTCILLSGLAPTSRRAMRTHVAGVSTQGWAQDSPCSREPINWSREPVLSSAAIFFAYGSKKDKEVSRLTVELPTPLAFLLNLKLMQQIPCKGTTVSAAIKMLFFSLQEWR